MFNQSNLIFFLQHPSVEQRRLIKKEKNFFKKSNNAINNIPSESKKGTPSVAQRLNGVVFHKKINGFSEVHAYLRRRNRRGRSSSEERKSDAPLCVDRVSMKSEEVQWVLLPHKRNVARNDGNSTGR